VAELLGFQALELGGGNADNTQGTGGDGGALLLTLAYPVGEPRRFASHVPIHAVGGTGYRSGRGGRLSAELAEGFDVLPPPHAWIPLHAWPSWVPALVIAGDSSFDAGASGLGGSASSGNVVLRARGSLESRGKISARGGASDAPGDASGGNITLSAANNLTVSGELSVAGADSAAHAGGSGGCIHLSGRELDLSATVSASGGAAISGEVAGGNGGSIHYQSSSATPPNPQQLLVRGGAGMPAGEKGHVLSDGAACMPASPLVQTRAQTMSVAE
jgi:hypothetical protein